VAMWATAAAVHFFQIHIYYYYKYNQVSENPWGSNITIINICNNSKKKFSLGVVLGCLLECYVFLKGLSFKT